MEYEYEVITAVQDMLHAVKARAGSLPQPPQLCYYHPTFGRKCTQVQAPLPLVNGQETPGAGIEEPPFLL